MHRFLKASLAVAPLLAVAAGGTAMAQGAVSASTGAPAAPAVTLNTQPSKASTKQWTQAERDAAVPMEKVVVGKATSGASTAAAARPSGPPGVATGSAGEGVGTASASVAPAAVGLMSGGFTYPTPFTRYEVESQLRNVYPYRTVGKLFFTQGGGSFVCSASVVSATEIWTAGHCAAAGDGRTWSTNMVFYPGYRDGTASKYGSWSCAPTATSTAWFNSGDLTADFAKAKCAPNELGKTVGQVTGWLGFAWNQGYGLHYDDFGYPQAAPFNGQRLQRCESSFGHTDTRMSGTPSPQAIGCDMTGGSSGGPWIWKLGSGNYINGENSYKYTNPSEPLEMYSPYYGDLANQVRTA